MSQMVNANIAKMVTLYLNTENLADIGVPLSSPSGSIVQSYGGLLGGKVYLSTAEALKLSDATNIGTLYRGVYQLVKSYVSASGAITRGKLLFWQDFDNHVVTPDVTAATAGLLAGVALCTVTKGNYFWMQVAGKASVLLKASITKATPASGDLVIVDQTPAADGDILADATQLTSVTAKAIVGVAMETPVGGAIKLVLLRVNTLGV